MMKTNNFTIIIDSREQKPYLFPKGTNTTTKKLDAGDYSVAGYEDKITIERKSKIDAYGTIGKGRKRFIRELERMEGYDFKAIVIESSMRDFVMEPPYPSKLNPKSAINSLISWSIEYGVHICFVNDREMGMALVYRTLEKYYLKQQNCKGNK